MRIYCTKEKAYDVRFVGRGEPYGLNGCLTWEEDSPAVEFYWESGNFTGERYNLTIFTHHWMTGKPQPIGGLSLQNSDAHFSRETMREVVDAGQRYKAFVPFSAVERECTEFSIGLVPFLLNAWVVVERHDGKDTATGLILVQQDDNRWRVQRSPGLQHAESHVCPLGCNPSWLLCELVYG